MLINCKLSWMDDASYVEIRNFADLSKFNSEFEGVNILKEIFTIANKNNLQINFKNVWNQTERPKTAFDFGEWEHLHCDLEILNSEDIDKNVFYNILIHLPKGSTIRTYCDGCQEFRHADVDWQKYFDHRRLMNKRTNDFYLEMISEQSKHPTFECYRRNFKNEYFWPAFEKIITLIEEK